jgi:hypothetical protein
VNDSLSVAGFVLSLVGILMAPLAIAGIVIGVLVILAYIILLVGMRMSFVGPNTI